VGEGERGGRGSERQGGSIRQHTATHCNTLQHTTAHCSTLQHTKEGGGGVRERQAGERTRTVLSECEHANCNTLQRTATHCNTREHKRDCRERDRENSLSAKYMHAQILSFQCTRPENSFSLTERIHRVPLLSRTELSPCPFAHRQNSLPFSLVVLSLSLSLSFLFLAVGRGGICTCVYIFGYIQRVRGKKEVKSHSNMWRDAFICVTGCIHTCDMTHSNA